MSRMCDMKVSVITVVFNAVGRIDRTIRSVLNQTYPNIEYIVVDGGSTDGTVDLISQYKGQIAYFVSERDRGLYDAMNKGVVAATGDWIGVMNAGDVYASSEILSKVFSDENGYDGIDVIYGNSRAVDGDSVVEYVGGKNIDELVLYPIYRHGASFVRRSTHLKYLFDLSKVEMLGFALDYYCIYSMYRAGCKFRKVDVMIMEFEKEGLSNSACKSLYYNFLITHDLRFGLIEKLAFIRLLLIFTIKNSIIGKMIRWVKRRRLRYA